MLLHPFIATDEKIADIAKKMKDNFLYSPDCMRTDDGNATLIKKMFGPGLKNEHYEVGDFGGLVSVIDIKDGDSCEGIVKIWDKAVWGPKLARELIRLLDSVMDKYNLRKVSLSTADPKMAQLAILCGIRVESVKKDSFLFDGKKHDSFRLSKER